MLAEQVGHMYIKRNPAEQEERNGQDEPSGSVRQQDKKHNREIYTVALRGK